MKRGGVEEAALIKWWDTLDVLAGRMSPPNVKKGLQMARDCRHPDAQWLCSRFPEGSTLTDEEVVTVMLAQGDDPRALFLMWNHHLEQCHGGSTMLRRAAELGYAPAQADLVLMAEDKDAFAWAERAAVQGDRWGLYQLADLLEDGRGCERDRSKAVALFGEAADLGCGRSQSSYGTLAFGERDWQRYYWWGRAAARGIACFHLREGVIGLLPLFEQGECSRILFAIGLVLKEGLNVLQGTLFGHPLKAMDEMDKLHQVVLLYEAMQERARRAVVCWSIVGRRLGVAKDVCVLIAKMALEEAWQWGEKA